jgi:hypothetical protein
VKDENVLAAGARTRAAPPISPPRAQRREAKIPLELSALEVVLVGATDGLAPWWGKYDDAARAKAVACSVRLVVASA